MNDTDIICVETGRTFKNATEAAQTTGTSKSGITRLLRTPTPIMWTAGGFHWLTGKQLKTMGGLDEARRQALNHPAKHPTLGMKILCVETGQIYNSINKAIKSCNGRWANIRTALDNPNKTAYGYHWQLA